MTTTATKGEIVDAVISDMGWATTDTTVRSLVGSWLDDALTEITSSWPWADRYSFLREVNVNADSFASFTVPAPVSEVRMVRIKDTRRVLRFVTYEDLFEAGVDLEERGVPQVWYRDIRSTVTNENVQANLWPFPSSDVTLQIVADLQSRPTNETTPIADADYIDLPRALVPVLRELTMVSALLNEGQEEQAMIRRQIVDRKLENLKGHIGSVRSEAEYVLRMDGDLRALRHHRPIYVPDSIPYNET